MYFIVCKIAEKVVDGSEPNFHDTPTLGQREID